MKPRKSGEPSPLGAVAPRGGIYIYIYTYTRVYHIYIYNLYMCWPLVPKFAGSNPAEAVGFLRAKKSSARLPSEGK